MKFLWREAVSGWLLTSSSGVARDDWKNPSRTLGQASLEPDNSEVEPIYAITSAIENTLGAYVSAGQGLCAPSWKSWFPRWVNRGLSQEQCDFVCTNAVLCEGINFFAPQKACESLCIVHLREHAVAPPGWTLHKGFLGFLHSVIARPMQRTECWAKVPSHGAGSLCEVNTEENCRVDEDCGKDAGCLKSRCFCSRGCFHDGLRLCLPWSDARWKPREDTEEPVPTTTTTAMPAVIDEPTTVCNLGEELKEAGIINSLDEFQPPQSAEGAHASGGATSIGPTTGPRVASSHGAPSNVAPSLP